MNLEGFKIDFLVDEDEDLNDRWVEEGSQKRHKRSGVKVKFRIKVGILVTRITEMWFCIEELF